MHLLMQTSVYITKLQNQFDEHLYVFKFVEEDFLLPDLMSCLRDIYMVWWLCAQSY